MWKNYNGNRYDIFDLIVPRSTRFLILKILKLLNPCILISLLSFTKLT